MYMTRLVKLLMVALAVVCVAQASWIDLNKIHLRERRLVRRASPSQSDDSQPSATAPDSKPSATQADPASDPAPTDAADPTSDDSAKTDAEATQATNEQTKPSATDA